MTTTSQNQPVSTGDLKRQLQDLLLRTNPDRRGHISALLKGVERKMRGEPGGISLNAFHRRGRFLLSVAAEKEVQIKSGTYRRGMKKPTAQQGVIPGLHID